MKKLMLAAVAAFTFAAIADDEVRDLTDEERQLLKADITKLTPEQKIKRKAASELRFLRKEGGDMTFPGTPKGGVCVVNLQKRVPEADLASVRKSFQNMMGYDIRFTDKEASSDLTIRIVDRADGREALTVWPDTGRAEINVAVLAADSPKPAFLAARTRKEIVRAFAYATAGSTYGAPLFGKLRGGCRDLDNVGGEDFTLDITMRATRFLGDAGVLPARRSTYRAVLQAGYDVAPTNGYQKAIYEKVKAEKPFTKKLP